MTAHSLLLFVSIMLLKAWGVSQEIDSMVLSEYIRTSELIQERNYEEAEANIVFLELGASTPCEYGMAEFQYAVLSKNQRKFKLALKHFNLAFNGLMKCSSDSLLVKTLNHKGEIYRFIGRPQLAIQSYLEAEKYIGDTDFRARAFNYNNLGNVYKRMGELDSASYYYLESLRLKKEGNVPLSGKTLHNLAGVYYMAEKPQKSAEYYKEAVEIKRIRQDSVSLVYSLNELALIQIDLGNLTKANSILNNIADYPKTVLSELRYYEIQELYYSKQKDFENALKYKTLYSDLYKRHLNEKQLAQIQELDKQYETQRKNDSIRVQREELKSQRTTLELQEKDLVLRNVLIALFLLVLLIIGLILVFLIQRSKRLKEESELKAIKARLEGVENTKSTISRDLHDVMAPNLHGIRVKLEAAMMIDDNSELLSRVVENIEESARDIRRVSHRLSPLSFRLSKIPFVQVMENTVVELTQEFPKVSIESVSGWPEELNQLSEELKGNVYAIFLELMHNAGKHSEARMIKVICELKEQLSLKVIDDGKGMKATNEVGIGLQNIESRVEMLNGEIIMKTSSEGTEIVVFLPIQKGE